MTKSPNAFRTISEAAEEVGVPQHVLRFWETKFTFVDPVKRAGGRRFYRPRDIDILKGVRRLLHDEGLTIRGVEKLHKAHGLQRVLGADAADLPAIEQDRTAPRESVAPVARLRALADALDAARSRLDAALSASL